MLDAVLVHAMPSIIGLESVDSELMVSEQMVALVGRTQPARRALTITIADLRDVRLMIPPRELAPSATVGMISMCRSFGGFEPSLFESAAMATTPLGPEWLAQAGERAVAASPGQPGAGRAFRTAWRGADRVAAALVGRADLAPRRQPRPWWSA